MKNYELYKKTVDVLYEAYFNDELEHQRSCACAVGNICKEASSKLYISRSVWARKFYTTGYGRQIVFKNIDIGYSLLKETKTLIKGTGYTWKELAQIEYAFETAGKGWSEEDWNFNGLVAVLDVLKTIHNIPDNTETVRRFTEHHATKSSLNKNKHANVHQFD